MIPQNLIFALLFEEGIQLAVFCEKPSLQNGCRKQKLQKEIERLEKLARKEVQPKKKFELVSQKRKLEEELKRLN